MKLSLTTIVRPRVHNFIGGGEYPTSHIAYKHTAIINPCTRPYKINTFFE